MDAYGALSIDDLLDLPNDDDYFFSSSAATDADADAATVFHHHDDHASTTSPIIPIHSTNDFNDILCIPSDDAAELEWLSTYMDDSFTDFPTNTLSLTAATANLQTKNDAAFHGRAARSKRSRTPKSNSNNSHDIINNVIENLEEARRCSHCASEKTPQWRTGPMGPKTLCNACGVRYKSGRLVPEYRPAASPTFVLTQHSNSHRKVMELRRQKEIFVSQPNF